MRKAALGVLAALLKACLDQVALAQLWVISALPMVRDVEASLARAACRPCADLSDGPSRSVFTLESHCGDAIVS